MKKILFVTNKQLPENDCRIQYALQCREWKILMGMPGKTPSLQDDQYVHFDFREGLSFSDIKTFFHLFQYLRNNREIEHVHFFSTKLLLFGPIVSRLAGVPCSFTHTGFGRVFNDNGRKNFFLKILYLILIRLSIFLSTNVLFQNRGDKEYIQKCFPGLSKKFDYIGSSAMMDHIFTDKDYRSKNIHVLLVTRLIPSKGIEDFLEIAETLSHENITFNLVGPPSSNYPEVEKKVIEYHRRGIINYTGELHGKDLCKQYEKSHIFLFPSYGEGLPRVLLEAGIANLCPVVYDINANVDLVNTGFGEIVKLRNREAMRDALLKLIEDRETLSKKAQLFHQFITKFYSFETYLERMNKALESMLTPHEEDKNINPACVKSSQN